MLIIYITILLIISVIVSCIVTLSISNEYKNRLYYFSSVTFSNIKEMYPESEDKIINDIFNNKNSDYSNDLEKYGIDINSIDFSIDFVKFSTFVFFIFFILIISIFIIFIFIFVRYIRKQDKRISKLSEYSDQVLNNNYNLDIRDNDESNLSILKNKIYDLTVMLKERNLVLESDKKNIEKLIADISHQIKTPLTSLNILNDLMYEDIPNEKKEEFLRNISKELNKIDWLIKNLLNLAKLDSKTLILKKEEINAYNLFLSCKSNFEVVCDIMGINIEIEANMSIRFLGDKKWTSEAINNLIKNSIEHKSKNIKIIANKNAVYTEIIISDDGEGIDKQDIPHIFDRFYKSKNSKSDSMGLGLSFVKSIILNQNGEIKVNSIKDSGTKFVIKIYNYNI